MRKEISKQPVLLTDICQLIDSTRTRVASAINSELSFLYWNIGKRIHLEILQAQRAEYGIEVIKQLADKLTAEYGRGWGEKQLRHCLVFAEIFPDETIVYALRRQLSWTHLRTLMYIKDDIKRNFYTEICKNEGWSSRQLQERIKAMLYERTAISKKPDETIQQELKILREEKDLSLDLVFRDPYLLDFLGLSDSYSEKDLESAILVELQRFVIEMGNDFAFMSRQKRISIDNRDYYIDLLFYHRRLKRLVAIDLKIGEFEAGYKGQMELYLRYLEKHEMLPDENSPIGLILCTGKNEEHVELLQLEKSNIRVAEYLTQLPSVKFLQKKLHQSIEIARQKILNLTL
jgi:predicted nuclease of restriction endonuclease-like (RecB) superfamily